MIVVNAETPDEAAAVTALLVRQDVLAYRVLVNGAEQPPPGEFERITSYLPDPEKPARGPLPAAWRYPEPRLDSRHAAMRDILRAESRGLTVARLTRRLADAGMTTPRLTVHAWLARDEQAGYVRRSGPPHNLWRWSSGEPPLDPRRTAMRAVLRAAMAGLTLAEIRERLADLGSATPRETLARWLVLDTRAGLVREAGTRPREPRLYEWAGGTS